jgi:hypothetical protein
MSAFGFLLPQGGHGPVPASYFLALPPGAGDSRVVYAQSLAGLFIVSVLYLIEAQFLFRRMRLDPLPFRHPLTVFRMIGITAGVSGVMRNGPDVTLYILWRGVQPGTRYALGYWNRILDGWSAPPHIMHYALLLAAIPVFEYQLRREPLPVHLYPEWGKVLASRAMAVIVLLMILVGGLAFLG